MRVCACASYCDRQMVKIKRDSRAWKQTTIYSVIGTSYINHLKSTSDVVSSNLAVTNKSQQLKKINRIDYRNNSTEASSTSDAKSCVLAREL